MRQRLTLFAALMLVIAVPIKVSAYDFYRNSPSGHRLYYTVIIDNISNNNTLRVEAYPSGVTLTGDLVIPDSVLYGGQNCPVTEIGSGAFQNKTGLTSVVIPSTVNRIESNAFVGCNNLRKVSFNNPHLSYVGEDAFYLSNYNSAYVGHFIDTVSISGSIYDWCNTTYFYNQSSNPLYHCYCLVIDGSKVDSLYVPEGVSMLKWGCLTGAPVEKVILPTTLRYIGSVCFSDCSYLEEIIIPDAVTFIGSSCFSDCRNLRKVTFGVSVDSLNAGLFLNCISLDTIIFKGAMPSYIAVSETQHLFWIKTVSGISLNDSINPTVIVPCGQLTAFQNSIPLTTVYSCNEYGSYHSMHSTLSDIQERFHFKALAVSNDTVLGVVEILNEPSCNNTSLIIRAIPSQRCRLYQWSDGDTNAFRVLSITQDTSLVATFVLSDTIYIHDTMMVHDTTYINILVHDTTYIDVPVHDTTIVTDTVTLTEYVPVHDTTYIDVPVHDTAIVTDTVTLTEYVPVHDTTILIDTVVLTEYDTLTVTDTLWLTQYDTVWLHDTVIVHDTIYIASESIDGADALNAKVYACNGQIVVKGAEGNTVTLYDVMGRKLTYSSTTASRRSPSPNLGEDLLKIDVPESGTYLIRIGDYPARKVVVIR